MSLGARQALVVVVLALGAVAVLGRIATGLTADDLAFLPVSVEVSLVGSVLVLRAPGNRVSWLLFGLAATLLLTGATELVVPGAAEVVTGALLFAVLLPGLAIFLPLWFPTGRPPTPRWNWVAWLYLPAVAAIFGGTAFAGIVEGLETYDDLDCVSPGSCTAVGGLALLLLMCVASLASLVVRWYRSSGVERLQLRWLVPSFAMLGVGLLAEFGGGQATLVANVFGGAGMVAVPISIAVAILRYRLYDIDRIISRTVGYALVTAVLAAVYMVGAVWLPTRLTSGQSSSFVAGSTLAIAMLFNPVRRRVQSWVDQRFHRSRYDAERVTTSYATRLRDEVDMDRLTSELSQVVTEHIRPSAVGVWMPRRRAGSPVEGR